VRGGGYMSYERRRIHVILGVSTLEGEKL